MSRTLIDPYALYRAAVQDPEHDVQLYQGIYRKLRGKRAQSVREDFCGTFSFSCAWVQSGPKQTALALDLSPEPLKYGLVHYLPALTPEEVSRIDIQRKNVLTRTQPRDLIVAGNFSFCIFKDRATLVKYFRYCVASLKKGSGALILDVAGGPDLLKKGVDRRKIRTQEHGTFTYEWESLGFDPISHDVRFAIHFKLSNGRRLRNAFTYDWRHWKIPEIRDAMIEAGFKSTSVMWDVSNNPRHERLVPREKAKDQECYIAYVVGLT